VTENRNDEENFVVPSRADHNRFIRKLWKWCIGGAIGVFIVTGGIVLALFLTGHDSKKIVEVSTSVFQVLILSYGLGFFVPTLLTSLFKMSLGVEMSRKALEIGNQTAESLDTLKKDIGPLLKDGKELMADMKPIIADAKKLVDTFKDEEMEKARKALHRIEGEFNGGGKLDRLVNAIERLAKRADAKADDVVGDLLEEAWGPEEGGEGKEPQEAPKGP
jgi:hypothetical protein